jgi:hypothetical protein
VDKRKSGFGKSESTTEERNPGKDKSESRRRGNPREEERESRKG